MEELKELKELCKPLVDYLKEKHHPHTKIIINQDRIELLEETMGIPLETYNSNGVKYFKDKVKDKIYELKYFSNGEDYNTTNVVNILKEIIGE